MMKFSYYIFLVLITAFLSSCVSVQLGPDKPKSATGVKFTPPTPPFVPFDNDAIDSGWKNTSHGTSISYKSVCNGPDLPLESIQETMLIGIENMKILKSARIPYSQREALVSVAEGKVDGVPTKMQMLILKKNYCTYMLSYVALIKSYEKDVLKFQHFLNSFEAP